MSLPVLGIVKRALSGKPPESVDKVVEFIRQEMHPVLKELRSAFNSLKGPSYNFGSILYGSGPPSGTPSSSRAIYIDNAGGAGAVLYDWNGVAWELVGGGGGGSLAIQDEGIAQGNATTENFVGAGVTATVAAGIATITIPGAPAPATTVVTETAFGQAQAVGVAVTYAREDHTHGTPAAPAGGTPSATVASEILYNLAPSAGAAAAYSRGDHTHGSPPFFYATIDFGAGGVGSVTTTIADPNVVLLSSRFSPSVYPAIGRDTDEMEIGPVVAGVGNIIDGVSFDMIAVSLDGDATGQYVVTTSRYNPP